MLLTGFPSLTYNPITKNPFHANFKVDTNSLYINYVLNEDARSKIESYIDDDIELEQISLEKGKSKNFFLSINIYNVTSPILNTLNTVTRCEINTYVKRHHAHKDLVHVYRNMDLLKCMTYPVRCPAAGGVVAKAATDGTARVP